MTLSLNSRPDTIKNEPARRDAKDAMMVYLGEQESKGLPLPF